MPYEEPRLTPIERKLTDNSRLQAEDPGKLAEAERTQPGKIPSPALSVPAPAKVEWAGDLERRG